jgi:hypothetical protein
VCRIANMSPYKNGQMVAGEKTERWCTRLTSPIPQSCRTNTVRSPSFIAEFVLVINSNTNRAKLPCEHLCSLFQGGCTIKYYQADRDKSRESKKFVIASPLCCSARCESRVERIVWAKHLTGITSIGLIFHHRCQGRSC